jgi:hypothetical protein
MIKTEVIDGQLSTVLDMKEVELLVSLLENLHYLKLKNQLYVMDEEKDLLEKLKSTPSHAVTHRNT